MAAKQHILLLEADKVVAQLQQDFLKSHGYTVSWAQDAQQGIFCADIARPDVVIMDLQLIGHSGIEFLYEFRSYADWQQARIIIYTGIPSQAYEQSSTLWQQLGIYAYCNKFTTGLRELLDVVSSTKHLDTIAS